MLTTRLEKIPGHPKGEVYHFDLVDPTGPSGRGINQRQQLTLEGIRAIREACDKVLEEGAQIVELMESPKDGPYLKEIVK